MSVSHVDVTSALPVEAHSGTWALPSERPYGVPIDNTTVSYIHVIS